MAIDVVQNRKSEQVSNPNNKQTNGLSYIGVTSLSGGNRKIILSTRDFQTPGFRVEIKDESGFADTGPGAILVETEGSEKIDGEDSIPISEPYGSRIFTTNGTNWNQSIGQLGGAVQTASSSVTQLTGAVGVLTPVSFSPTDVGNSSSRVQWEAAQNRFITNYPFFYDMQVELSVGRLLTTNTEAVQFYIAKNGQLFGFTSVVELIAGQSVAFKQFNFRNRFEPGDDLEFGMVAQQLGAPTNLGLYAIPKANPALVDTISARCTVRNVG